MSTDLDWTDALDRAIPVAPDTQQPDALAAGRSALRRRRLTVVGAGVAGTAAAASIAAALLLGGTTPTAGQPGWAGGPDPVTPTPSPTSTAAGPAMPVLSGTDSGASRLPSGVVKLYDEVDVAIGDGRTGKGWAWLDEDGRVWFGVGHSDAEGAGILTSYPSSRFADESAIAAAFHAWIKDDGPFEFGPTR